MAVPGKGASAPRRARQPHIDISECLPLASTTQATQILRQYPSAVLVGDLGSGHIRFGIIDPKTGATISKCSLNARLAEGLNGRDAQPKREHVDAVAGELARLRHVMETFRPHRVRIVGTEVLRRMKKTQQGCADIARFEQACRQRILVIDGAQEAAYNADAVIAEIPELRSSASPVGPRAAFAAMGGGSLQTGLFSAGSAAQCVSVPYGIETLITGQSGGQTLSAQIGSAMGDATLPSSVSTLYIAGGIWRTVAKIIAERSRGKFVFRGHTLLMSGKDVTDAASRIADIKTRDFNRLGSRSDRSATSVRVGAAALAEITRWCHAQSVVFCHASMRQAVARDRDFGTKLDALRGTRNDDFAVLYGQNNLSSLEA